MIGWRGPLSLLIGAAFIFVAAIPERLFGEPMPMPLRVVIILFMTGLMAVGLYVSVFTARRNRLLATTRPVPCQIEVFDKADPEDAGFVSQVMLGRQAWRVPLAPRRAVRALAGYGPRPAEAWLDASGAPVALRAGGEMLETYPVIAREGGDGT